MDKTEKLTTTIPSSSSVHTKSGIHSLVHNHKIRHICFNCKGGKHTSIMIAYRIWALNDKLKMTVLFF